MLMPGETEWGNVSIGKGHRPCVRVRDEGRYDVTIQKSTSISSTTNAQNSSPPHAHQSSHDSATHLRRAQNSSVQTTQMLDYTTGCGSKGERQKSEWHAPTKCETDAPPRPQCAEQLTAPCPPKFARFRDAPPSRAKFVFPCRSDLHHPDARLHDGVRERWRLEEGAPRGRGARQKRERHAPTKCKSNAPPRPQFAEQLTAPCAAKFARFRNAPPPRSIRLSVGSDLTKKSKMRFWSLCGSKKHKK